MSLRKNITLLKPRSNFYQIPIASVTISVKFTIQDTIICKKTCQTNVSFLINNFGISCREIFCLHSYRNMTPSYG